MNIKLNDLRKTVITTDYLILFQQHEALYEDGLYYSSILLSVLTDKGLEPINVFYKSVKQRDEDYDRLTKVFIKDE